MDVDTGHLFDRLVATAVNGLEVVKYGGLRTEERPAPYDVVEHRSVHRLRHYFPAAAAGRPPVLLVPPLMQVAEVWDLSPETSVVAQLHQLGMDPWVVDFGDPKVEPGGSKRTFSDHVLAVADAIASVANATGLDVHLGGYSQGGIFCYVAAAYRSCDGVASVFTLGSPVQAIDVDAFLPEQLFWEATRVSGIVLGRTGLPRQAVKTIFNWMNPTGTIKSDVRFLLALHDRESLLPREPQRKFLKRGAWIGWSGPAIQEALDMMRENRLMEGGSVIGDHTVGLADLTCPILLFIGEADTLVAPKAVRAIALAAPKAVVYECVLPVGHFGLPVSSHARTRTWPGVAAWANWCSASVPLPEYLVPLDPAYPHGEPARERGPASSLSYSLGLAAHTGVTAPRALSRTSRETVKALRELSLEAATQLPRVVRLERMTASTRVSYGSVLDEMARTRGAAAAFIFADRAHTHADAKRRIDNVVKGLLSVGVRRGEHVGVLMDMRPSALVTVAALNRIGAVTVLLRPGHDIAEEIRLGQVTRLVTDPSNAPTVAAVDVATFVLGSGATAPRTLPPRALDLELVDPEAVQVPDWYRPNPGRARDLAFVLFQGAGAELRADRITNGRWATSAYAAAAAAALTREDTIYSVSPLHHASGLLLATGAAVVSGARLAAATGLDPGTFWSEVRRYGATVVPYTWTMLHPLVEAAPVPEERNHPIRLFVGSGLPTGLWRRVEERFGPARVLELYASTRTDAILGNVSDRKVGCAGRPLPGTPQVRIVDFNTSSGHPRTGADGYAIAAPVDETGLLLVEARAGLANGNDAPLRGLFAAGDAWVSTGDLFRRDEDGDLWYVDSLSALITTPHGVVSPRSVENLLGSLDAITLAACYPVPGPDGEEVAAAAVVSRSGSTIDRGAVDRVLATLPVANRPDLVHVMESIPMTSWSRPATRELQALGVPVGDERVVWARDSRSGD